MSDVPDAETVSQFRKATGMGWMAAKRFLSEESPELCWRIIRAGEEQVGECGLYDPIEDDPAFSAHIAAARERARRIAQKEISRRERRHHASGWDSAFVVSPRDLPLRTAVIMKKLLQREGIQWYTRMEMNPCSAF